MAPQTDQIEGFTVNVSSALTGSFTASIGAIAYLLTASEYAQYLSNHSVSSYLYTTGNVTQGTLSATFASGTYHLVFHDPSASGYTTVTVQSTIQVAELHPP